MAMISRNRKAQWRLECLSVFCVHWKERLLTYKCKYVCCHINVYVCVCVCVFEWLVVSPILQMEMRKSLRKSLNYWVCWEQEVREWVCHYIPASWLVGLRALYMYLYTSLYVKIILFILHYHAWYKPLFIYLPAKIVVFLVIYLVSVHSIL